MKPVHTTFEVIELRARKRTRCQVCKKPIVRAMRFWQTINPFNRDDDGYPKTREQIWDELQSQAAQWKQTPEMHTSCQT